MYKEIKKIVHIADIHVRTLKLHDLYKKQFNRFFDDLKELNQEYDREEIRIVITGDLVHQKINISNEQFVLLSWILDNLTKYGIVVIIPGNHDFLENNKERMDSITPIVDLLDNPSINYYKTNGLYMDNNINWIVYSLYQHNRRPDFTRSVQDSNTHIGLFHGPIQGLSTDLGFKFEEGYDKLNFADCDIVLCGDIHKRQVFELPKTTLKGYMVGSFIQQDFSETIKHHGWGLYDVETGGYEFFDLPNEQPYMTFKINDIDDINDGKEVLVNLG